MNWQRHLGAKISKLDIYGKSSNNVLFISIQKSLIRSKAAKAKATLADWVFYSDPLPYYLSSLSDWYIVLYDYDLNSEELVEDVVSYIDKDLTVILAPKGEIVDTYLQFSNVSPSYASCIVGDEASSLVHYEAYQVFPKQPAVILPEKQALILTMGQPLGGRKEVFEGIELPKYVFVEKKGAWKNKISKTLLEGKSVIFQAGNASRADRKEVIDLANKIPVYVLLFTFRGKDRQNKPGVKKYPPAANVFEGYSDAFQEPTLDEGLEKIYRVN